MMKCKSEECEKLKQEVTSLKADQEKAKKQESKLQSGKYNKMTNAKKVLETNKDAKNESGECSQSNANHKEDRLLAKAVDSIKSTKEDKGKSPVEQQVSKRNTIFNGSCSTLR